MHPVGPVLAIRVSDIRIAWAIRRGFQNWNQGCVRMSLRVKGNQQYAMEHGMRSAYPNSQISRHRDTGTRHKRTTPPPSRRQPRLGSADLTADINRLPSNDFSRLSNAAPELRLRLRLRLGPGITTPQSHAQRVAHVVCQKNPKRNTPSMYVLRYMVCPSLLFLSLLTFPTRP